MNAGQLLDGERARLRDLGALALARRLIDRFSHLARKEVDLARLEFRRDARRALAAAILGGAAAATGISALVCLLVALLARAGERWSLPGTSLCAALLFSLAFAIFLALAVARARTARPRRSLREAKATLGLLARARRPPSVEPR